MFGVWAVPVAGGMVAFQTVPAVAVSLQDVLTEKAIPGWEIKGGPADSWAVEEGVLTCTGTGSGEGWIGTKADYTDFVIEFEFKLPPGGNSGVYLRVPKQGHPTFAGMEVQILDDYADHHKNLEPGQYCGSLYKIAPPARRVTRSAGQWNQMRIIADRDHIVVVLNGETIVDADGESHPEILKRSPRGPIGFQNHRTGLWLRNIRLADLAGDRAKRAEWFREAKFGMFIHWGVYAVLGEGEWNMQVSRIPAAEYEKLPPQFNPAGFDAAEWVSLARRAGQKYMVITSKHHDGFAMYDSKVSDYDIVDRTPFKRDPMKALAAECRKQGLRFGFYHSILDWHHPDYEPVPDWDKEARARHKPDFDRYLEYMRAQVRELCTNYGPLACIWWDGGWDHKEAGDRRKFASINAMIRQLQPHILINDRANTPEDFTTPEQYIPPTGITNRDGTPKLWENCITLTTGHGSHPPMAWWGYDKNETEFKTAEFCIRMLVDIVSKGGNLLLNVGPTAEGKIQPAEVQVLEAMGRWLEVNGEAIYGTTASPFRYLPFFGKATVKSRPQDPANSPAGSRSHTADSPAGSRCHNGSGIGSTQSTLYLHVFAWPGDRRLVLPGVSNSVGAARLLADPDRELKVERVKSDLVVYLTGGAPDPIASVVALELDGPPRVEPFTIRAGGDGTIVLPVLYADLRGKHGQRARYETAGGEVHMGNWTNKEDYAAWQFETTQGGTFEVMVTGAADKASEGGTFEIAAGPAVEDISTSGLFEVSPDAAKIEATVRQTGGPTRFATRIVGRLELPAGSNVLVVKPVSIPKDAPLMNLRQVRLKPVR